MIKMENVKQPMDTPNRPIFVFPESGDSSALRSVYIGITGDNALTGRIRDSKSSRQWLDIVTTAINTEMLRIYNDFHHKWKSIVPDVGDVHDFREKKRLRLSGYGKLPQPESNSESLDAEIGCYRFCCGEKGDAPIAIGIDMIKGKDGERSFWDIPGVLANRAYERLKRTIFDLFEWNPMTSYDSTPLFHYTHKNIGAEKLNAQSLYIAKKTIEANTGKNLQKWILLVSPEIHSIAKTLNKEDKEIEVVKISCWSSKNDWVLLCDQTVNPAIEFCFFKGMEKPRLECHYSEQGNISIELFHLYGTCLLDHNGVYKGTP